MGVGPAYLPGTLLDSKQELGWIWAESKQLALIVIYNITKH